MKMGRYNFQSIKNDIQPQQPQRYLKDPNTTDVFKAKWRAYTGD